ncbi:DUF2249 domain-containing protein [Gordonia phthalatica]|uniref:DUF2249 domain-containing protein n=1 Tax=Gordonia phthalatica TaxID=1136941 RepID=A0A0N9N4H0_9ACTN|nr:DUF2249 domain-containing protein [Gordonia phthalatica]ALG85308.1 hypothetical protein ACH46_13525 [Gordonia phthalatica]
MPDTVVMASNEADANTVNEHSQELASLVGRVTALETAVVNAARGDTGLDEATTALSDFAAKDLRPRLEVAKTVLFPAAAKVDRARLLVEGLLGEAHVIGQLLDRVTGPVADPVQAAADARGLRVLLEVFFGKVSDLLLPALAEDSATSLTDIIPDNPLPDADEPAQSHGHAGCSCGEHDDYEPELDVREIPHAIRHATVFGAFDTVAPGNSMILIAHHDPIPLLHQLADRSGGRIQVEYEERGPEAWRLRLTRV